MHSTVIEVETLLDRAVELLLVPTLANMRSLEEVFREAIVRMPERPPEAVSSKVKLCGRLLESAQAGRPGGAPLVLYNALGGQDRVLSSRLLAEA